MANVDERRAETDDLKTLMNYLERANELAIRLKELGVLKCRDIMDIIPLGEWVSRTPSWNHYNYLRRFMKNKVDFLLGRKILVSIKHAKNWGYLLPKERISVEGRGDYYAVELVGSLDLRKLLVLYKMYEEGLLRNIMKELESAIPKLKKEESRLKKALVILEIMGIPPV